LGDAQAAAIAVPEHYGFQAPQPDVAAEIPML
jgi:hypothetical protein